MYVWERAERLLSRKDYILSTHGQEVWDGPMQGAVSNSSKLYTDLGLTKEEFAQKFPLTYAELGD